MKVLVNSIAINFFIDREHVDINLSAFPDSPEVIDPDDIGNVSLNYRAKYDKNRTIDSYCNEATGYAEQLVRNLCNKKS